jgi:hypothetical protein
MRDKDKIVASALYLWTEGMGRFSLYIPGAAILAIARGGPADEAIGAWKERIARDASTEALRTMLRETGAWEESELTNDATNWERVVWIAACDVGDESASERCEVNGILREATT